MTTKETVLLKLLENQGECIAGGELAREIGVSRNAVHKVVNELKEKGVPIESVHSKGYTIAAGENTLSAPYVKKQLTEAAESFAVNVFAEVTSTNTLAKELALTGEKNQTAFISSLQTQGRGRRDRSFYSPKNGLYFSLMVRPENLHAEDGGLATTAMAVAVSRVLSELCAVECGIKWVNDIFINGKKICGILTEAGIDMETGRVDWLVVGVGINLTAPEGGWPAEISEIVGSVFSDTQSVSSNKIAAEIINCFSGMLANLSKKDFMDEYRERSILIGNEITVLPTGKDPYTATATDIDKDGKLIVKLSDGTIIALNTGEVSIKIKPIS